MPDVISWMKKLPGTLKSLWAGLDGGIKFIRGIFMEEVQGGAPGRESTWKAKDMGQVIQEQIIDKISLIDVAKIGGAIAAIFLAPKIIGMVGSGIGKLFGMGGGGGGVPGVPGAGGAENTMGGKLGKNVGGLIGGLGEGVMKGAAAGLAAFANPKILIGAGILGGAIAAIALGIGASAWILGKTVGPFAETLKKFENVDGDALIKTGAGMVALGKGLGYLGGGQIIKAIGNLFSGGSDPFAQVQKFSDQNFDEAKITSNANAMVAFEKAMESLPTQIKKDSAVTAFGLIATLFGAGTVYPWDQVKVFSDAVLGESANLVANADKLKLFGVAMENMPTIVPSTQKGGFFGWIATGFGTTTTVYPWTQVKTFADAVLGESANLIANAGKLKLFGAAMENMPAIVPTTQTGGFFGWIKSAFPTKTVYPWDQVKAFAEADMGDTTNLASNATAMAAFSQAMTGVKPVEGTTGSGGWLGKISNFLTGSDTMPWDQVKIFGSIEINAAGVIKNAKAMSAFAQSLGTVDGDKLKDNVNNIGDIKAGSWTGLTTALTGFQAIDSAALDAAGASLTKLTTPITALAEALPKDIKSRLLGFGSGLEELADYINDGELKTIGKLAEHLEKINLLGPIFDSGLSGIQIAKPATRPSRLGQNAVGALDGTAGTTTTTTTAVSTTATADLVNAENSTIAVNADMLTSANNRETILGEIKVLLQELNTTTKDAKTGSEKSAKKLKSAVAATNPFMGI